MVLEEIRAIQDKSTGEIFEMNSVVHIETENLVCNGILNEIHDELAYIAIDELDVCLEIPFDAIIKMFRG